jgi:cell division protein FtsL
MKNIEKYIISIVIIIIAISSYMIITSRKYNKKIYELQNTIDSLTYVNDSLQVELLPIEIEFSRYENTLEILKERNLGAANEFWKIYQEETE